MAQNFTTDTTQWAIADEGVYVENPEFVRVILDNENKILEAIRANGTKLLPSGVEVNDKIDFEGNETTIIENPEFIEVKLDKAGHILWGIQKDGNVYFGAGVPQQVIDYINERIAELSLDEYEDIVAFLNGLEEGDKTLQTLLNEKVDKEEGKSLIDADYASSCSTSESPEFLDVKTDAEGKILEATKEDGTKVIYTDFQVLGNMGISGVSYKVIENQEYLAAWLDAEDKVIFGFKADGKTYVGDADFLNDIENIKAFLANITDKNIDWDALSSITTAENPEFIEAKTDSEGKLLAGRTTDGAAFENVGFSTPKVSIDGHIIENIEDIEERSEITTDSEDKIISYRDTDGVKHEVVGIETDSLQLTEKGMTEFQKALKDSGFNPGGRGDWSDYISNNGEQPLQLPIPQIAKINFICDIASLSDLSKADRPDGQEGVNYDVPSFVEYWDNLGNYFKKPSLISGQGNSTMNDPMRSISMDLFDSEDSDDAFAIKFGDWVAQDSFHVKAYYKDVTKGVSTICYKIGELLTKTLSGRANRLSKNIYNISAAGGSGKAKYDYATNALCHPDGFPVEVYHNGNYYGLSVLSLKKHRANYSMDKNDYTSVLIDNIGSFNWTTNSINWSIAEFRNPKTLYCMDGTKYDGDHPKEIIDSTSQYYNPDNANHVNSAAMKELVLSFLTAWSSIKSEQDVTERKRLWNENFDVLNAIVYIIFSNLTYNMDGRLNNAQVSIYNNKMGFNIYDCDSCLGKTWSGFIWSNSAKDIVFTPSTGHPLNYIAKDFKDDIKAIYKKLRDSKIIDVDTLTQFMLDWSNRIGYEVYKRSLDAWTNNPSYRKANNLNSEYWKQIVIGVESYPNIYDENISYSKGDKCRTSGAGYDMAIFECIKDTEPGIAPLISGEIPNGCYDSPFRYKKWFELRIATLDEYYNY